MKQKICIFALVMACLLIFTGCQCAHMWDPATCEEARTCQNCGVAEGEALGHSWKPATCNAPKVCEICKETEGKALKHTWTNATCATPKTCNACGLTDGDPLTHTWVDADCETPKTCGLCGATEGAPLGHTWQAASCAEPKICAVCATVDGETPGHSWVEATCNSPKTCSVCNLTEGKALGHNWQEATTEKPKTCTICGKTEGTAIQTDHRFTTAACQAVLGPWEYLSTYNTKEYGYPDYDCQIVEYNRMILKTDGTMIIEAGIKNFEDYKRLLAYSMEQEMYASFAEEGKSKADADAACVAAYGMTVSQLAAAYADEHKESDFAFSTEMVYYVENGQIYAAESWSDEMVPVGYRLEGDKLILTDKYNTVTVFYRS